MAVDSLDIRSNACKKSGNLSEARVNLDLDFMREPLLDLADPVWFILEDMLEARDIPPRSRTAAGKIYWIGQTLVSFNP